MEVLEGAMVSHASRTRSQAPKHTANFSGERALTETQVKVIQIQGAQMVGLSL